MRLPARLFNECSASLKQLMIWKQRQITSFRVKFSVFQCKFNGFVHGYVTRSEKSLFINHLWHLLYVNGSFFKQDESDWNYPQKQLIKSVWMSVKEVNIVWHLHKLLKSYTFKWWEGKYCAEEQSTIPQALVCNRGQNYCQWHQFCFAKFAA